MSKPRRTVLSGIVTPIAGVREPAPVEPAAETAAASPRAAKAPAARNATKAATVQQTLYLPPAVHEQLRELAFAERIKMHALILEGLDAVFKKRGMKSIANLTTMR